MRLLLVVAAICPLIASAVLRLKLKEFFPFYRTYFIEASSRCTVELDNYWKNNRTTCPHPCACAADCLLDNLPGTIQTNMASAVVLLGLVPPTLVFIGPSLAEMAALSLYNPLLATLLSIASPAVNLQRLFQGENVMEAVEKPVSLTFLHYRSWLDRYKSQRPTSLFKWLLAIAALANNVSNSVYLDLRTISGWRCSVLLMPLVWSALACSVQSFAMIAARFRNHKSKAHFVKLGWRDLPGSVDTAVSECLIWLGTLLAISQMMFGILDLSSLTFISALDALRVAIRYGISAIVCQIITLNELASLRWELRHELSALKTHQDGHESKSMELFSPEPVRKRHGQKENGIQTW